MALFALLLLVFASLWAAWLHTIRMRRSTIAFDGGMAALAAVPFGVVLAYVASWLPANHALRFAAGQGVIAPFPLRLGGSCFVATFLVFVWLRLRRRRKGDDAPEPADRIPRRARQSAGPVPRLSRDPASQPSAES